MQFRQKASQVKQENTNTTHKILRKAEPKIDALSTAAQHAHVINKGNGARVGRYLYVGSRAPPFVELGERRQVQSGLRSVAER